MSSFPHLCPRSHVSMAFKFPLILLAQSLDSFLCFTLDLIQADGFNIPITPHKRFPSQIQSCSVTHQAGQAAENKDTSV